MTLDKKLNKVAEITLLFWLMKIVATTLGETLGDFLSMTLNLGYLTGLFITAGFFILVLLIQLSARQYKPVYYWLVIISTTTLGTEVSDFMDRSLNLGYTFGSIIILAGLIVVLIIWFNKFGSLSVNPFEDISKETFYWIAILFSISLITVFGDFLTDSIGLSYINGALLIAFIMLIVYCLYQVTRVNPTLLFWIAFIFTRPFGATFGDFLTKSDAAVGLDLGTLNASIYSNDFN